ncbi:UDP-N-acetylglucosamine pyrophosphorylase, putative [Plasmodium relictum]|uniref:UDP-N-acetylglucosamine diphosphorylase n=1 Tax=Plasmodium relictum TaxID=85471 RepID=A0A1J1HA15_PLARL|nr:UDP-N-acetylglucosamine pyrophosphorylase, putative [Plasmodium relictum]CRH01656.1 UDP-N-acetylglucosamine pyrophosphorylase, putative [Plasmodium relictum]
METAIKLLEQHNQLLLCDHLKKFPLHHFDNSYLNNLELFLKKMNEIKNLEEKKEDEYITYLPNYIDINSIYDCKNPENGSIFINMYKKECALNELKCLGLDVIKKNEVAVLFLSGGLGSRLGLNKAKGLLEVTPLLNKTFFQIYFEQIKYLESFCSFNDKTETLKSSENENRNYHSINHNEYEVLGRNNNDKDSYNKNNIYINSSNINNKNNNSFFSQNINCINSTKPSQSKDIQNSTILNNSYGQKKNNEKVSIHIYIMTSNYTHDKIVKYLEENKFFGLRKENVLIFKQCDNYSTDFDYNIILSSPNKLLANPAGNGDVFRAIYKNGIIEDMVNKNIKYIQIVSIDNVLNKIADPVLIGFCSFYRCDIANKSVKRREDESMGVFCLREKKNKENSDKQYNPFSVCEYTEIPKYISKNSRLFEYGNICHHMFSFDFLHYIVKNKIYDKMKLHKITREKEYYDLCLKNKKMNPVVNSFAYCYEYFVFDVFKYAKKILSFEISRDKEFIPIKSNYKGDSILEAQRSLSNLHKSWLINQNFNIIDNEDEKLNFCEISPLVSYDGTFFFDLPKYKNIYLPYALDKSSH